jgi:hypothetical protein
MASSIQNTITPINQSSLIHKSCGRHCPWLLKVLYPLCSLLPCQCFLKLKCKLLACVTHLEPTPVCFSIFSLVCLQFNQAFHILHQIERRAAELSEGALQLCLMKETFCTHILHECCTSLQMWWWVRSNWSNIVVAIFVLIESFLMTSKFNNRWVPINALIFFPFDNFTFFFQYSDLI